MPFPHKSIAQYASMLLTEIVYTCVEIGVDSGMALIKQAQLILVCLIEAIFIVCAGCILSLGDNTNIDGLLR